MCGSHLNVQRFTQHPPVAQLGLAAQISTQSPGTATKTCDDTCVCVSLARVSAIVSAPPQSSVLMIVLGASERHRAHLGALLSACVPLLPGYTRWGLLLFGVRSFVRTAIVAYANSSHFFTILTRWPADALCPVQRWRRYIRYQCASVDSI